MVFAVEPERKRTGCPISKPPDLAMFLPFVFNHYFSDFSNPPKTKKSQGAFPSPPASPQKNWASVFFFQSKKRRIWNITSLTLPRLHPAVPLCRYPWSQRWWSLQRCGRTWDPVRGEGGGGMLMLWDTWFYSLKKAGKAMLFLKKMGHIF